MAMVLLGCPSGTFSLQPFWIGINKLTGMCGKTKENVSEVK